MEIQLLEKTIESILNQHKQNNLSTVKARDLILVAIGKKNSACCKLDRLPNECSIFLHTSFKKCEGCGHYY